MNICKYCGNPIEGEPVMNIDEYGNGYHHFCLVDKEFREAQRQIYDKGKADAFRWIPVSERLPEEMGTYLVSLDYKEYGTGVTTLWFHNKEIGWDLRAADVVTAWMPLPEPYKKGEEEE